MASATIVGVVVLQKSPTVFLIAMFVRGFWLEVSIEDGRTKARYLHKDSFIAWLSVGSA